MLSTYFKNNFWKSKFLKDASLLYSARALNMLVGLGSTLIYGIIFKNEQIATISLFEMIVNLFVAMGFSWSSAGVVRFGKEEYIKNKRINYTSSVRLSIVVPLLGISALIIILNQNNFIDFVGTRDVTIIAYLTIQVVLIVFNEHLSSLFMTAEKHSWNALFLFCQTLGRFLILIIFYLNFQGLINSAELYIKFNVYLLLLLFIIRIPFAKSNLLLPLSIFKREDFARFVKFVLPQVFGFAGLYLINWVDAYFIRLYCDIQLLGSYQFLYSIFLKVSSFALILNVLFFPKLIDWRINDINKLKKYLSLAPKSVMVFVSLGIISGIALYPSIFSIFFDDKFSLAYSAFNILLLTIPFYFATYIFVPVLNAYDKVVYVQAINLLSAMLNVAIDYLFIIKFGLVAAALATFSAYLMKCFLLVLCVRKIIELKIGLIIIIGILLTITVFGYFFQNIFY